MNLEIFKANDIRGIYKKDFNESDFYKITLSFIKSGLLKSKKPKIILGYDLRDSYKILVKSVKQALIDSNVEIIEIGQSTTPLFYFAVNNLNACGGIMVTASHNPKEYNGLKIVKEKAILIGKNNGLNKIKNLTIKNKSTILNLKNISLKKSYDKNVFNDYLNFLTKNIKLYLLGKIIFDTGNGMVGIFLPKLLKKLSIDYIPLYFDVDFNFPNHESNPAKEETLKKLKETVIKEKAILGVAFDGDGDRIVFIDEFGNLINSSIITVLLAKEILEKNKGGLILYSVPMSKIIEEEIKKMGGTAMKSKVGHSFIKQKATKLNSPFGGELSGHYYFKETNYSESSFLVLIKILEILSREKKPISEIVKPYQKYFHSPEINFNIKNKKEAIEKLKRFYSKQKNALLEEIDGVTVSFPNWWFNARTSNTESLLRLNVEANSKKLMNQKINELIGQIKHYEL